MPKKKRQPYVLQIQQLSEGISDKELIRATRSAVSAASDFKYKFTNAKLISFLGISENEMLHLSYIVSLEMKKTRKKLYNQNYYVSRLNENGKAPKQDRITERRELIHRYLGEGKSCNEICQILSISAATYYRDLDAMKGGILTSDESQKPDSQKLSACINSTKYNAPDKGTAERNPQAGVLYPRVCREMGNVMQDGDLPTQIPEKDGNMQKRPKAFSGKKHEKIYKECMEDSRFRTESMLSDFNVNISGTPMRKQNYDISGYPVQHRKAVMVHRIKECLFAEEISIRRLCQLNGLISRRTFLDASPGSQAYDLYFQKKSIGSAAEEVELYRRYMRIALDMEKQAHKARMKEMESYYARKTEYEDGFDGKMAEIRERLGKAMPEERNVP